MKRNMIFALVMSFFNTISSNECKSDLKYEVKKAYAQNNNRIDRQKHAQFNQQKHQPRKHNHGIRHNHRRNQ